MPEMGGFELSDGAVTTAKLAAGAVTTAKLAADAVTEPKIKDGEITTADIAAAAAIAFSKLATDPAITRIKTGTYTGDGTTSQAITGVGFQPKMLWIWRDVTAEESTTYSYFVKTIDMYQDLSHFMISINYVRDNLVESLDSDGFTVNDDNGDLDPNKNGQSYVYVALG